jgi:hypothetical protein
MKTAVLTALVETIPLSWLVGAADLMGVGP